MKYFALLLTAFLLFVQDADSASLQLPRFASLSSGKVNMRTGPGLRYPIDWVLTKRNLPIEIIHEFENWVNIRDVTGDEGWVHKSMISSRRYIVVTQKLEPMYQRDDIDTAVMGRAERGVIAKIEECNNDWCKIKAQNIAGWMTKSAIWGVYEDEVIEN